MKTRIPTAVIVVFTAGMLLGWEIGVRSRSEEVGSGLVPVVVALKDIPAGTRLDNPHQWLGKRMYLRESAPLDGFSRLGDLLGQVVRERVRKDDPCTARYLAHAVPIGVPVPGSRAVTFTVRELPPFQHAVLIGSRADLIYTGPDRETGKVGSVILVENVLLLAIAENQSGDKKEVSYAVTVALAPADADQLLWARDHGSLTVAMRRPNESSPDTP